MNDVSHAQEKYIAKLRYHKIIVSCSRVLIFLSFLILWEICADTELIDSFIFSSPIRIISCFYEMLLDRSIFIHTGITLYETITSFLLVTFISIFSAVILWCNQTLSQILEPYLVVLNSLPKSALAPLLIVWFGATPATIIVAGISVAIFGSIMSLYTSFTTMDEEKIKLIYTLHGTKRHALFKVVLPGSVPVIISNMKVNIGLCLVGVVIGEFLAARSGLGYLIIYSSQTFKMDWLIMSILLLCFMAMLLYAIIGIIEKLYRKNLILKHKNI